MINDTWPLFTKGWIGILALFFLISCVPQDEILAKPIVEDKINLEIAQKLSDETTPIATGAISLDEPRQKINLELVKQLKEEKKAHKKQKIHVLIDAKNKEELEKIKKIVSESGGEVKQTFDVGSVLSVELPLDKIEEISQETGVIEVAPEKEYIALVEDRITAFSIDEVWENNITGTGVRIAILDTGVGPHDAINVKAGKSFVSNEDEKDQNGHGTHVAGIAQKVAKDAVIYNAKVLSKTGGGTTSQILAGINWAVNPDGDDSTDDGADIISMSFGGLFTELDGPLASTVKEAIQKGVLFVAAAGNCKQGCGGFYGVTTPGNVKEVIAVGAVDDDNNVAGFSSGDTFDGYVKPDVVAPGIDITSAWLENGEKTLSGTSMSTPFVSGVIALMLEKESLTQEEAKEKLTSTAKDLGDEGWDARYGAGLVDVGRLLGDNQSTPTPDDSTIRPEETIPEIDLTGYVAVSADANITTEWITSDCPENLAYSPELNITKAEFLMIYEYCISQLIQADDHAEMAENEYDTNQTTIVPRIYLKNPAPFDPSEVVLKDESSIANKEYKEALKEKSVQLQSFDFSTLSNAEPLNALLAQATTQISYTDNYAVASTKTDGKVWSAGTISGLLTGLPSGVQVVCYDWCKEFSSSFDHCFATSSAYSARQTDFQQCSAKSSFVSSMCSAGKCDSNQENSHPIPTCSSSAFPPCSPGYAEKCTWQVRYYKSCNSNTNYQASSTYEKAHYTVKKRQHRCTNGLSGGTYGDLGDFNGGSTWVIFNNPLSCSTGNGCDEAKDDSLADFGTYGTSTPNAPCSLKDGYGDCDNDSDCLSGYCSQVTGTDYCCPSGQEWDGSKCATPTTSTCSLSSASWDKSGTVNEGTVLTLTVSGNSGCSSATFDIYEDEVIGDTFITTLTDNSLSNGVFTQTWTSSWMDDGALQGDPEYYFIAKSGSSQSTSGNVNVKKVCNNNGACDSGETNANCPNDCKTATCTDGDGDGYGNPGSSACSKGSASDCDDTKSAVNPGANEICGNGIDDNCNQQTDEGCTVTPKADGSSCTSGSQCQSGYCYNNVCRQPCVDNDNDGYGTSGYGCGKGLGDCDDNNNKRYPGNTEVCDNYDNDCDGSTNEGNVCCGDNTCNYGETSSTCLKDCPKSCSKNSDCPSGAWCGFTGLIGTCKTTLCQSTCTNNAYSCISDSVYQCKDGNNDGCYENIFYKQCGPGLCENGKSSCITTTPSTKITIEEAEGTIVNVQKGDIITANLKYTKDETIELQYDSVFALDTSTCLSSFTIKGSKQCRFTVSNSANPGKYKIGLKNGQQTTVKVVSNPSVIILTNKPKLYIRFNNAGVYDLLKQAYSYADGKQAVVYDLDDYLTGHPWTKLDDYKEKYDDQQLKDNSYSLEVSQFIAEKCNECSTLILGDDFVVPHYRRDLDMSTWFGLSQKTDETYSDIAYIQRTTKTFAEFEELFYQKDKFDGKNVLVVLPDNVDTAKRKEIDKLENFLKNHNEIKAKISEKNASDVVCNSKQAFSYYDGYTLIIVGTSKTNGALNCFPFVIENDLETITIERNPWDGRAYAIVVNSDNTDLLTSLNGLLDNGTYKQLDSSGWLIARTTANVAVGIAIGSLALGASPVVLLIAGAASVAADSIDGAECWKFKGSECTEFVVGLAIPFGAEKVGKPLIKSAIDTFGPRLRYLYEIHGESIIGAIKKMNKRGALAPGSKTGKYFKSLTDEFDVRTIKKYLSKEEADIAQEGTELLGDEFSLALKDFEPKLPKEHRLNLLKYAGDSEQAIRYAYQNFNEIWVPFVPKKGTFLFRGDNAYSYNPSKSYPGIHRIAEFVPLEEHAFKNVFNALIPTTKDLTVAAQHAVKRATSGATFETYILVINPRALNGIDIDTSYHLTHGSQLNFLESEVGIVSNVNTREIVGVIKGKVSYLDGSVISRFKPEKFEPNPAYVADSSNPFDYKKAMEALK